MNRNEETIENPPERKFSNTNRGTMATSAENYTKYLWYTFNARHHAMGILGYHGILFQYSQFVSEI